MAKRGQDAQHKHRRPRFWLGGSNCLSDQAAPPCRAELAPLGLADDPVETQRSKLRSTGGSRHGGDEAFPVAPSFPLPRKPTAAPPASIRALYTPAQNRLKGLVLHGEYPGSRRAVAATCRRAGRAFFDPAAIVASPLARSPAGRRLRAACPDRLRPQQDRRSAGGVRRGGAGAEGQVHRRLRPGQRLSRPARGSGRHRAGIQPAAGRVAGLRQADPRQRRQGRGGQRQLGAG